MATTARELKERYAATAKRMHELHDKAEAEDRGFTTAEETEWNELKGKVEDLDGRIKRAEEIEVDYAKNRFADEDRETSERQQRAEAKASYTDDPNRPLTSEERSRALRAWGLGDYCQEPRDRELAKRAGIAGQQKIELIIERGRGPDGLPLKAPQSIAEAMEQARFRREARATNITGTMAAPQLALGGYLVPDEMMRPIDVALLAYGGVRQVATIVSTAGGAVMPIPTVNDTAQKGYLLTEDTEAAVQELAFSEVRMSAYKFSSKIIPVSVELMQDAAVDMAQFIGERIGERLGRITNQYFTLGAGTTEPKGIVVCATNSGLTEGTAGKMSFVKVLGLTHTVDPAYRALGGRFMMHDQTLAGMKAMEDDQHRPLWLPSLVPGEPSTFLGFPYTINQDMAYGAASKGLIFGALSKYLIRDVLGIVLLRLDERYAEFHRVAFLAFMRCDGNLLDAGTHPVKYLTLA